MAISTNGTVIARLAGGLYNTVMSNATYLEVAAQDPSTLANTLYARDFAKSTDLAVATTLLANLGLASQAGLDAWVAAQLTAAGAANKGAKIVSLLNDFAGLASDATWGTYATSFNTKVDAALAASQKTGSVEAKFEAAGAVAAATNATFTLTTGMDKGAAFTGGAGNDTLVATVATMGALDVVTGGDGGVDVISINESVDVASLPGSYTGFETLDLSTSGAIGAVNVTAGTTTAAVANEITLTPSTSGTFATSSTLTLTIGSAVYSGIVIGSAGAAGATAAITTALKAHLGDDAQDNDLVNIVDGTTKVTVTSKKAGTALPTISVSTVSSAGAAVTADTVANATVTDKGNTTATGPGAIKEVIQLVMSGTDETNGTADDTEVGAGDNLVVSIDGVDYVGAVTPSTANSGYGNVADAATSVATLINSALGAGVAVASGKTITVTAPTAGTPLPYITTSSSNSDLKEAITVAVANQTANAAVTSASAVSAPTGITTYNATASGVANVTGAATAKMVVSGTTVQTSGGLDVTVTGTKAVGVSGAKGAVVIKTSDAGSGEVISNPGTSATTTTYGSGIYVSGGTTVGITQTAAKISSTGSAGTIRTGTIQVGVNPTAALVNGTATEQSGTFTGAGKSAGSAFNNTVGGSANSPTGDVTISTSTTHTTSAGKTAIAYGTGAASVYTNGGSTVSITGAGSGSSRVITVTDVNTTFLASSATDTTGAAGTSKLATVNLTGIAGDATIKSDAISTVNVKDATGGRTVTVSNSGTTGANSGAFNLNVGNSTVTVTNATATSVNVGSTAATTQQTIDNGSTIVTNASALTLNAVKATSLNFTNADAVTLTTGTGGLAKVATITASGAGNLTANISDATNYAKLVTVDASAKTGKVALTLNATASFPDSGQVIKTGSGNDTVTLTGAIGSTNATLGGLVTTTIDLGAGNDALAKSGGSVATGAAIDAGAGTDTVEATLVTIGNSAIFKNFERVSLKGATDAGTFDATVLANSSIDGVTLGGDLTATGASAAYSVTNLVGTTATVTASANFDATATATLATATGTADVMNINFARSLTLTSSDTPSATAVTAVTVRGIKTSSIETVNVSSAGTITNTKNFVDQNLIKNTLTLFTDTTNKTTSIVVTGNKEFVLGGMAVTRDGTSQNVTAADFTTNSPSDGIYQNSTLDAADTATADVQAALTLIDASGSTGGVGIWAGTKDALTASWNQIYDGLTIKGGSGSDMIRNDAKAGVTTGGDGADWLVVNGSLGTADGGAGNDTLVAMFGSRATLTGGTGANTFDVSAAKQGLTTTTRDADANVLSTDTIRATVITDFKAGDTLKVNADTASSGVMVAGNATVTASGAQSVWAAIDAALEGSTVGTNVSTWFNFGGNTYIVTETGSADGFTDGDIVVLLTGLHTLTAAAAAAVSV